MSELKWVNRTACYEKWLPLDFLPPEAAFVFYHSNNMMLQRYSSSASSAAGFIGDYPSQDVIVVGDQETDDYLLLGAATCFRSLTYFTAHRDCRFTGVLMTQPEIKPEEEPEKIIMLRGNDWRKLLKEYAETAAREMGVKPFAADRNLTGYCTWYYYYDQVSEANLLENIDAIAARKNDRYSCDVIQIDDGYQPFQGDWLERDASWPEPLEKIVRRIENAGAVPGIWLMPFLASTASKAFREHRGLFVRNSAGEPLVFAGWSPAPDNHWACLDATIPECREYIAGFMKALRRKGFRYFKMDGLGFGLPHGVFADPEATAVSAFRQGMKTIREAVPDSILLGCCPPFMPCLGYVDMCRVSCDTSRYWYGYMPGDHLPQNCDAPGNGIRNTLHGVVSNWFLNDIWFRSDPDVLMTRSDNAWYTEGEARLSAAGGILTGVSLTSDHLGKITPERYELLVRAAKYRLRNAVPADWKSDRWPTVFTGTCDEKPAALFLNDTDETLTFRVAEWGLPAQMNEVLIGRGAIQSELSLPPHDAAFAVS